MADRPGSRTTPLAPKSKRRYWVCAKCGTRNERVKQKCANPDCARRRPKKPMRAHKRVLRDNTYAAFEAFNAVVHGPAFHGEWTPDCCGVCGKPPKGRRSDRDHDHRANRIRGLACPGHTGCNVLMLPWVTAATAYGIAEAKSEVGEPDAPRWYLIAQYLTRVDEHYEALEAAGIA